MDPEISDIGSIFSLSVVPEPIVCIFVSAGRGSSSRAGLLCNLQEAAGPRCPEQYLLICAYTSYTGHCSCWALCPTCANVLFMATSGVFALSRECLNLGFH